MLSLSLGQRAHLLCLSSLVEVDDRLQLQVVVVERHHHAAAGHHHRVASDGREADVRVVVGEEELHAFFVSRGHEASIR